MGYQIQYGSTVIKKHLRDKTDPHKSLLLIIGAVCLCCILAFSVFQHRDLIWEWILPGDPQITKAALTTFWENIRCGIPVGDAIEVFCKEILSGAMY